MAFVPDFGFCGPSYELVSPVLDSSKSFNLYPEPMLATSKSHMALIGRPGLSNSPFMTLPNSPARSLWAGDNRLFAVGGQVFQELSAGGSVKQSYGTLAGSSGLGPCTVRSNGAELIVYDSGAAALFYANPDTGMGSGFGMSPCQVVDSTNTPQGNMGATALEYLDGFHVAIANAATCALVQGSASPNPNMLMVSNFLDGYNWPALNYVIRTGSADLPNALAVLNGELWIFGQKNTEVWYNAGNALFPFARIAGATLSIGCIAPGSVARFYNTIMWLGADDNGYAQVYMTDGLKPVRVSTPAIEQIIAGVTKSVPGGNAAALPYSWALPYQEAGHTFYQLTLCNSSYQPLQSIVYDLNAGLWHERGYGGAYPVCFASVPAFNNIGPNFVGDGNSGRIYFQGIGYPSDGGTAIEYQRTAPFISGDNLKKKHRCFELDGDFGTAQPYLTWSNDGGRTYKPTARAMAQAADEGEPTDEPSYQRFRCSQLGSSRNRNYRMTITDSTNLIRIANAYLDVVDGIEDKAAA